MDMTLRAQRLRDAVLAARDRMLPTKELAKRSGVKEQSIYKAMAGPGVGPKVAKKLAPHLGVSATWLTGLDLNEKSPEVPQQQLVPQRVREWGEWMKDRDADIRRPLIRVGEAMQAARRAQQVGKSPTPDTSRKSTHQKSDGRKAGGRQ